MSDRVRWLVRALVLALVVALAAWIERSIEWVDVPVADPAKGEAARDPLYAAKRLARRLGAEVTTIRNFEQLPPPATTLVIASHRWAMFPGRDGTKPKSTEGKAHA